MNNASYSASQAILSALSARDLTRSSLAAVFLQALQQQLGIAAGLVVHRTTDAGGWKHLAGELPHGESADPYSYDRRESVACGVYNSFLPAPYTSSTVHSLAVILWCESRDQRLLATSVLADLSSLIEFALRQADDLKELRATREYAATALAFPRGSDDQLAYMLLDAATNVTSRWHSLTFWRVSRIEACLEKVAELTEPRQEMLTRATIPGWLGQEPIVQFP